MSLALSAGIITFVPRERTRLKSIELQEHALRENSLTPAGAGKIRGVRGFTTNGTYGKIGRTAMGPLKQRQYSDTEPWLLSGALRRSLMLGVMIDGLCLKREVSVFPNGRKALVVSSDARLDESAPPSAAVLIYDSENNLRIGAYTIAPQALVEAMGESLTIAVVESMPIVLALIHYPEVFAGRDVVWFEDNSNALGAMVKGGSNSPMLDRSSMVTTLLSANLRCRIWWEYIQSESNWSDSCSRLLSLCPWVSAHDFFGGGAGASHLAVVVSHRDIFGPRPVCF